MQRQLLYVFAVYKVLVFVLVLRFHVLFLVFVLTADELPLVLAAVVLQTYLVTKYTAG